MIFKRRGHEDPWTPLGDALTAFHAGDERARLVVHSSLWESETVAAADYYRPIDQPLPQLERRALELCRGRVLDVGAGAGRHALELQRSGHDVVALDINPAAVAVMADRGIADPRCEDLMNHHGGPYDTVLMLQNGIGVVGNLAGLGRWLERLPALLAPAGRLLVDSADLRVTLGGAGVDPDQTIGTGGYLGEVRFRLEFRGRRGPWYRWLFVDFRTLALLAAAAGLSALCLEQGPRGAYLADIRVRSEE